MNTSSPSTSSSGNTVLATFDLNTHARCGHIFSSAKLRRFCILAAAVETARITFDERTQKISIGFSSASLLHCSRIMKVLQLPDTANNTSLINNTINYAKKIMRDSQKQHKIRYLLGSDLARAFLTITALGPHRDTSLIKGNENRLDLVVLPFSEDVSVPEQIKHLLKRISNYATVLFWSRFYRITIPSLKDRRQETERIFAVKTLCTTFPQFESILARKYTHIEEFYRVLDTFQTRIGDWFYMVREGETPEEIRGIQWRILGVLKLNEAVLRAAIQDPINSDIGFVDPWYAADEHMFQALCKPIDDSLRDALENTKPLFHPRPIVPLPLKKRRRIF